MRWRDGVFAEIAHWPAACVTPLNGLDDKPATTLPLRFNDGQILLGPFPVGRVPPLF